MSAKKFALPDLGEGLTESEIVAWKVAVGDTVALNQVIAEVETAKALVELPSPFAGVVSQLFADEGATVQVGEPIVEFDVDAGDGDAGDGDAGNVETSPSTPVSEAAADAAADGVPAELDAALAPTSPALAERQAVLVGYGPKVEGGPRPARRARAWSAHEPQPQDALQSQDAAATVPEARDDVAADIPTADAGERPRSTPPVRKLARDLGIDLTQVNGTGEDGLITRDDVQRVAAAGKAASAVTIDEAARATLRSGSDAGRQETRMPIRGIRKATAQAMVNSAFTAPHVTEFLTVDVTAGMDLVRSLASSSAFAGKRITILSIVAKALILAARRTPAVNSHWDEDAQEIVQFGHINLGIAAATGRGLIVPNIKDADTLSLGELADALVDLVEAARSGATSPANLSGGTITITNVGVFGVDAGTPILNPGEAAILAMGAVRRMPWEYRGEIALREVMTLSLSFDHRLIDGEQGSRFLVDIGTVLSDPGMVLTMV
ncbi:dihydrolipoamide acetyltransferase family protein [Mycetocola miduiensis]|uniref:Dihydrolipoamide acetyltransferase component of pyruvate dehydrogenase complex n=1 Tax=Mycetocola miduiensis TaxID=995034 RepID=A0A1I5BJS4_9MICO|nr:dihydrolipoamide acetyltransferase family protein [Mycetocola miduiensis]SFN74994.1 pyruvate dehydrogenase E2 component (dihydrolipoamide acetyltransferase) [Mycetocola miduiensis]